MASRPTWRECASAAPFLILIYLAATPKADSSPHFRYPTGEKFERRSRPPRPAAASPCADGGGGGAGSGTDCDDDAGSDAGDAAVATTSAAAAASDAASCSRTRRSRSVIPPMVAADLEGDVACPWSAYLLGSPSARRGHASAASAVKPSRPASPASAAVSQQRRNAASVSARVSEAPPHREVSFSPAAAYSAPHLSPAAARWLRDAAAVTVPLTRMVSPARAIPNRG